jgi:hypothetical protein
MVNQVLHRKRTNKEFRFSVQIGEYDVDNVILDLGYDVNVLPKNQMNFGSSRKDQFVSHRTNTLDDLVGYIKLKCQFVMSLSFERCFLVRLEPEKHLITFLKNPF